MSRVLAIDYGRRRIGLAHSDPGRIIVSHSLTLTVDSSSEAVRRIAEYVSENDVGTAVVGYPLREDGELGELCKDVDDLIAALRKMCPGLEIVTADERYTSSIAQDLIHAVGDRVGRDKGRIDAKAAEVILRDFLESSAGG
jgi:putative Holliday junction resolvase